MTAFDALRLVMACLSFLVFIGGGYSAVMAWQRGSYRACAVDVATLIAFAAFILAVDALLRLFLAPVPA